MVDCELSTGCATETARSASVEGAECRQGHSITLQDSSGVSSLHRENISNATVKARPRLPYLRLEQESGWQLVPWR